MQRAYSHLERLEAGHSAWLEDLIEQFEEAWRVGNRPAIEAQLPSDPMLRRAALFELVHTEFEYRHKAGEPVEVEEYVQRFPELASEEQILHDLRAALSSLKRPVPSHLGRFELVELLGEGAFGAVYRACDTELGRIVAVKVPHPRTLASPAEVERFLREARSAAQLRHPGIVTVHEVCRTDKACFLVTEFVAGQSLAERLKAGPFGFPQSAELIGHVADALEHAHQHGVIHRDLKPANILLWKDEGGRRKEERGRRKDEKEEEGSHKSEFILHPSAFLLSKIADFGLAKWDAAEATLTQQGQVLGTPAYMSPEQARGEAHEVDARSDIYSLGVILYEMLTGELPFRGSARMVLVQVMEEEPRPPRRVNDAIPRDLETICLKAMRKEAGDRYATAGALAEDLRRYLRGQPVSARPLGRMARFGRWCRRKPVIAGLVSAVMVTFVLGSLGIFWQWRRSEAQRQVADDNLQKAHTALEEIFDQLLTIERSAPELRNTHRIVWRAYARQYEDLYERSNGDLGILKRLATIQTGEAIYLRNETKYQEAEAMLDLSLASWRKLLHANPLTTEIQFGIGRAYHHLGKIYVNQQKSMEAVSAFQEAIRYLETAILADSSNPDIKRILGSTYTNLLSLLYESQASREADRLTGQALVVFQALAQGRSANSSQAEWVFVTAKRFAQSYRVRVRRLYRNNQLQEALEACQQIRRIATALGELWPDHVEALDVLAQSWYETIHCLRLMKRYQEAQHANQQAICYFTKVADTREKLCGEAPDDDAAQADLVRCYDDLGQAFERAGRLKEALVAFQKAIDHQTPRVAKRPRDTSAQGRFTKLQKSLARVQKALATPRTSVAKDPSP